MSCFRYRPPDGPEESCNEVNKELLVRLQESGIAVVSSTMLDGKFALRAAITNHRSKRTDFEILVEALSRIGADIARDLRSKKLPAGHRAAKV